MSLDETLSAMRPSVDVVRKELGISSEIHLRELVRAQLGSDREQEEPLSAKVDPASLARLYELRARYLDWTHETGYLGFFASDAGTRYAYRRRLEECLELLPPAPSGRFLEVGCGAGIFTIVAASEFASATGVDVSELAVGFADRLANRLEVANTSFCVADGETLPFPDGSFSAIACGEMIGHVSSPQQVARELHRVTAVGGSVVISTPCALSGTLALTRLAALVRRSVRYHREKQIDRRLENVLRERGDIVRPEQLLRVKKRFRYRELIDLMVSVGMEFRGARGATLDVPPAMLFYRKVPDRALAPLRALERFLNRTGLFARALSSSTIFRFDKLRP